MLVADRARRFRQDASDGREVHTPPRGCSGMPARRSQRSRRAAATAPPSIQLLSSAAIAGNQIQLDFTVANYQAGMTFQLLKASDVGGAYGVDASASFQTLIANSKFRATTSTGGAERMFYKIKGSY